MPMHPHCLQKFKTIIRYRIICREGGRKREREKRERERERERERW